MPHIEFLADRKEGGLTVSAMLKARFGLTWQQAKRLVERGHVRVAGMGCTDPTQRIRPKNRVWVREGTVELKNQPPKPKKVPELPPQPKPKPKPKKETVSRKPIVALPESALLYVDEAIVVVNKPAGLTTMRHSYEADEFGPRGKTYLPTTLADILPAALGMPNQKVIAVHRLDRDTTGVMLFARSREAAEGLTEQFRKHTVERRYQALVRGTPTSGCIDTKLVRDRGDGRRGSGVAEDGQRAVTVVKVLEQFADFALVECRLGTGRTHQVRIHLGEAGTPLCGETVYDRPTDGKPYPDDSNAGRPMLHAIVLGFKHPISGEAMTWESPLPKDFVKLLDRFQQGRNGV